MEEKGVGSLAALVAGRIARIYEGRRRSARYKRFYSMYEGNSEGNKIRVYEQFPINP